VAGAWGIALVDGDIEFETVGERRPRTVDGIENLAQALTLRVMTPLGNDRFNVLYGIDIRRAFVDPHTARETKDLIRMNLVRAIGTDPRVRDVREIVFEDDEPGNDVAVRLAKQRRTWTARIVVDTVLAEGLTFPVEVSV
jgi:phage baseplate assembly protein W